MAGFDHHLETYWLLKIYLYIYMFTAENTKFWLVTSHLLPMILWSNKVNKSEYIFQLLHPNEDLLLFLFQFWTCSIASLVISQV